MQTQNKFNDDTYHLPVTIIYLWPVVVALPWQIRDLISPSVA